jgi:hypothetical protein
VRHQNFICAPSLLQKNPHEDTLFIQGKVSALSGYSPLDLFSGSRLRLRTALLELLKCPQNNFAMSLDSKRVSVAVSSGKEGLQPCPALQKVLGALFPEVAGDRLVTTFLDTLVVCPQSSCAPAEELCAVVQLALLSLCSAEVTSMPFCACSDECWRALQECLTQSPLLQQLLRLQQTSHEDIESIFPLLKHAMFHAQHLSGACRCCSHSASGPVLSLSRSNCRENRACSIVNVNHLAGVPLFDRCNCTVLSCIKAIALSIVPHGHHKHLRKCCWYTGLPDMSALLCPSLEHCSQLHHDGADLEHHQATIKELHSCTWSHFTHLMRNYLVSAASKDCSILIALAASPSAPAASGAGTAVRLQCASAACHDAVPEVCTAMPVAPAAHGPGPMLEGMEGEPVEAVKYPITGLSARNSPPCPPAGIVEATPVSWALGVDQYAAPGSCPACLQRLHEARQKLMGSEDCLAQSKATGGHWCVKELCVHGQRLAVRMGVIDFDRKPLRKIQKHWELDACVIAHARQHPRWAAVV